MSSYYDDPDFAEEYRRRDEEAIDWAIEEKRNVPPTPSCPCACNSGGFCGGCGHAGCGGRR